jgi:hypothetical protein
MCSTPLIVMAQIKPRTHMPRLHLILLPSVLTLALPGWVEASPKKAPDKQARPLNLSVPRDVLLAAPANGQSDETVLRNLQPPTQTWNGSPPPAHRAILPYGAGYEHRHQEMGGAGGGAGSGPGAGSGAGRRGR